MNTMQLRTRLTVLMLIIAVPIFTAIVIFVSVRAGRLIEEKTLEDLHETNHALDSSVSQWLGSYTVLLKQLTALPDIISMDAERQKPVLLATAYADPDLFLVQTLGLNGFNVARNDFSELRDYSDRQWYLGARAGNSITTQVLISRTTGNPALNMAMPIRNAQGEIIGVVSIVSELDEVAAAVHASTVGNTGYAYVVDEIGHVVAHPDPVFSEELLDLSEYPPVVFLQTNPHGQIRFTDEKGIRWVADVGRMENGWGTIVQQQETELLSPLRYFQFASGMLSFVGVLLLLAVASWMIRQALSPIETLTSTALAITNGDINRIAPVERQDEVGTLASAFNSMTLRTRELVLSLEQRVNQLNETQVALKTSLRRQAAILDNIPDLAWLKDEKSRFIAVNEPFGRACGLAPADLVGKNDLDIWPEELAQGYQKDDSEVMQSGIRKHVEERLVDRTGRERWVETVKTPIFAAGGELIGTAGIARDITERKQVEEKLQTSEERYRTLAQNLPDSALLLYDKDLRFILAEGPELEKTGFSREMLEGKTLYEAVPTEFAQMVEPNMRRTLAGEKFYAEFPFEDRFYHYSYLPLRDGTGNVVMGLILAANITERKHIEEKLRVNEDRLQQVVRVSNIGIYDHEHNAEFIYWSPEQRKNYGFEPDEPVTMEKFLKHVHPDDLPEIEEAAKRAHDPAGDGLFDIEYRIIHRDGTVRWLSTRSRTFFEGEGDAKHPVRTVGGVIDITERKQIEEALRDTEQRYRLVVEGIGVGIWEFHLQKNESYLSPQYHELLGYEPGELTGTYEEWMNQVHPEDRQYVTDIWRRHVEAHEPYNLEYRMQTKSGSYHWFQANGQALWDETGHPMLMTGSIADITDRKQMNEALRESHNLLQTVLDTIPVRIFWKDLNLRYLGCNQPFAVDAGLHSPEDLIGKDDYQMGWREQADLYRSDDRRVLESGIPKLHYEEPQTTPDGRHIWLRTSKVPLRDEKGSVCGVLGTYEDITERKRIEEILKMFQYSTDQSLDAIFWMNKDAGFSYVNEQACHSLGYTREELLQLKLWDIDPDYPKEQWFDNWEQYQDHKRGGEENVETIHHRKNGTFFPVDVSSTHLWFGDQELHVAIVRDITERKRSESLLHLRLRLFEYAADHSLGELLQKMLDEVGDLVGSPIGFYHFVGADQRTLSLQAWSSLTLKEYCRAKGSGMHYSIDDAGVWVDCVRERRPIIHNDYASLPHRKGLPEGHAYLIRELVVPVVRNDRIVAILGVGNKPQEYTNQDVEIATYVADVAWELAERKHVEDEREKLINDLETKNSELERFTYTVSHDLKAPLVTIKGFLGFIQQDVASGNKERLYNDLERIGNATKKMEQLLWDLLELSRIGRLVKPSEEVPFDDLVREALEIVHGQLVAHGVTVRVQPDLPAVYGDRQRLVEVLQNLLDNAAKYMSDQGDPLIEIGLRGMEDNKLIFYVHDNGIGILPQYHERVFGLFNKLDVHSEGTGVGLALVKRIIEFHGGRIWIESEGNNTGTTFCFTLKAPPKVTAGSE